MEILNECIFIIALYCFLHFTEYVDDLETKNFCGWLMIYATVFNLVINFIVILVQVSIEIWEIFRKKKLMILLRRTKKYIL